MTHTPMRELLQGNSGVGHAMPRCLVLGANSETVLAAPLHSKAQLLHKMSALDWLYTVLEGSFSLCQKLCVPGVVQACMQQEQGHAANSALLLADAAQQAI